MSGAGDNGIVRLSSHHSVDQTVDELKSILASKGVTLFALVDHSGEAANASMQMPKTKLLISESGNAADAGFSHDCDRSAAEDPGCGGTPKAVAN